MSYPWILSERNWGGKISEGQWGAPAPEWGMSITESRERPTASARQADSQTRTNPPLRRKSLQQVTEQNSIHAVRQRHICVWQGREVTILIPEKVDFRAKSISWEYLIMMRQVQCTTCFIKLVRKKSPHVKSINQIFQLKNHPMIYTFTCQF